MTGDDRLGFARTVDDWLRSLAARNLRPRSVDAYRRILYAAIDLIGEQRDPRTLTIDDYELCLATWAAHVEPKPDAEKPLRFSSRAVVEAVLNWSVAVLVVDSTRSIDWIPERATCVRVSRRPQRWRCDIGGTWYDAHDDARYVTYRLRRCRPDRDAWANTLYRVGRQWRAAVSVDWRGGLRCRLVEPPYIPNADA